MAGILGPVFTRILGAAAVVAAGATVWAVAASGQATAPPPPAIAPPIAFGLTGAKVSPKRAFFGRRDVRISFALQGNTPLDLRVEIVRGAARKLVRTFKLRAAAPGATQVVRWDGLTDARRAAPDGRYGVRVVAPDGRARRAGALSLHGHMYPIRGPHADRGPVGAFGVGRNGGRTHEGFDVNAACGTPLVAARAGTVTRSTYDPVLYGNDVIIRGKLNNRTYRYSHLRYRPRVSTGDVVRTGQRIGVVGDTGNARTIGCHLHFELRRNGTLINPKGPLHNWDGWS
jgi:murein DD-endopeptidase MepM/ murein hydrolase activator NlpD